MLVDWSTVHGWLCQNLAAQCCRRANRFGKAQTSRTFFVTGRQAPISRGSTFVTNQSVKVLRRRFSRLLNNGCRKRCASIVRATNPRERIIGRAKFAEALARSSLSLFRVLPAALAGRALFHL